MFGNLTQMKRRGSWAPLLTLLAFSLLYLPFGSEPWGMHLAVAGTYSVFVFGLAFGAVFRDADDLFGNPDVIACVARLLIVHVFILAIITAGVTLWVRLEPLLPAWLLVEGRKGSPWYWCGMLVLAFAGLTQGSWMAGRIKRRSRSTADELPTG